MKYAKHLNAGFRKRYAELQADAIGSLSLRDEVVLYQSLLTEAIEKHQRVDSELALIEKDDMKKRSALLSLLDVYKTEIFYVGNQVRDMTLAAAKLENDERSLVLGMVQGFITTMCEEFNEKLGSLAYVTEVDVRKFQQEVLENARERLVDIDKLIDQKGIIDMATHMPADLEAAMMDASSAPGPNDVFEQRSA